MKHSHNSLVEVSVHHPEIDDIVKCALALSYAFERCQKVDNWKFNKARQNWLLRNVWSEQAVSAQDYRRRSVSHPDTRRCPGVTSLL